MLVIARRRDERIRVTLPDGRHGWIVLADVFERVARLGLHFPRDVEIEREELLPPEEHLNPPPVPARERGGE